MATTEGVSILQWDDSGVKEYSRTFEVPPASQLLDSLGVLPHNSFCHFQDLRFTNDVLAQLDHSWGLEIVRNSSLDSLGICLQFRVKHYPDKAFKLHRSQLLLLAGANRKVAVDLDFKVFEVGSRIRHHLWSASTISCNTNGQLMNRIPNWEDSVDSIKVVLKFQFQSIAKCLNLQPPKCNPTDGLGLEAGKNLSVKDLFLNDFLSDVTFVCESERIPAHRFVLSCQSPVFQRMFQTEMKERKEGVVEIKDVRSDVLKEVLHFMYKDELSMTKIGIDRWLQLYKFAHLYEIQVLKLKCQTQILGNISPENAIQLLVFADLYNIEELKMKALDLTNREKNILFPDNITFLEFTNNYPHLALDLFKMSNSN